MHCRLCTRLPGVLVSSSRSDKNTIDCVALTTGMYLTILEAESLRPDLVPYPQGTTKIKDLVKLKSQLTSNFLTDRKPSV